MFVNNSIISNLFSHFQHSENALLKVRTIATRGEADIIPGKY